MTDPHAAKIDRRHWIALVVLCLGQLMVVLDVTIVNVALPAIQADLGFSQAGLAWVVNAYLVAFGSFLLLSGRLGDLFGRKRVFISGLVLFTVASLACGLADTGGMLIAARFVQGVGAATSASVIVAIIFTMFPGPRLRARAMGVYTCVAAVGGSIGLLAGGVLTETLSWHWIFFVNVPIGAAAAVLGVVLIEETPALGREHGVDVAGAVLVTAALMLGVYTIVKAADYGWVSARTLGSAALAGGLLAAFVWLESRLANPLVPLRIFRSRNLTVANLVRGLLIVGMFGWFFTTALYLEHVRGYSAVETGLAFLPQIVVTGSLSLFVTPRIVHRYGAKTTVVPGLALATAGLAWFAGAPVDGNYAASMLPGAVMLGAGFGLAFMTLISLAMADTPPADAGLASGILVAAQQMAGALGLAVMASLAASHTRNLLVEGVSSASALTSGYRLAWILGTSAVSAATILAAVLLRSRAPAPAVAPHPRAEEQPERA
jgi:EmrB/QacA subfamily drug resistance transporter